MTNEDVIKAVKAAHGGLGYSQRGVHLTTMRTPVAVLEECAEPLYAEAIPLPVIADLSPAQRAVVFLLIEIIRDNARSHQPPYVLALHSYNDRTIRRGKRFKR